MENIICATKNCENDFSEQKLKEKGARKFLVADSSSHADGSKI
jgi:hypothetical protein